jgi:hypothetical protein
MCGASHARHATLFPAAERISILPLFPLAGIGIFNPIAEKRITQDG